MIRGAKNINLIFEKKIIEKKETKKNKSIFVFIKLSFFCAIL